LDYSQHQNRITRENGGGVRIKERNFVDDFLLSSINVNIQFYVSAGAKVFARECLMRIFSWLKLAEKGLRRQGRG
jgi:hypothetical protein